MFNAEKIKQAVGDTTYAKRLYQRWKRNGFEEKAVYDTLWKQHRLGTDNQVYKLYQNYVTWLDLHHPLNVDLGAKNMFASEKLTKAAENPAYANVLFGRWKRRGFTMINVRDQFKRMKITSEQPLYSVYNNYLAWLRIHYPKGDQPKTTDIAFLFNRDRINRAQKDAEFEIKLFAKWKSADFDENGVYNKLLTMSSSRKRVDDDLYAVYVRYLNWLEVNHPLPPLRNRRS
ncbi:RxLR effector protein [Phytophthora megakarya]|uniref:RxLR effector protein n=1 Tax=Phytophthora megakarya TaxID=4795 RepID=A0A225WNX6_9STRA|nr:RxLR effector protein [Phytophthora megakarya]